MKKSIFIFVLSCFLWAGKGYSQVEVYDMTGRLIHTEKQTQYIQLNNISKGVYIVKTAEGETSRLVIK